MGISSILSIYLAKEKVFNIVFKIFLIIVFIRFSLGVAVILNGIVDDTFLLKETIKNDQEITVFKNKMNNYNSHKKSFSKKLKKIASKLNFKKIEQSIEKGLHSFMNLMAIYILKTIIFPLFFFYAFLGFIKSIWKQNITLLVFNESKLATL